MNKNAIQKYAVWARNELIEQVKQRAFQYGISEKGYGEENAAVVNGRVLSPEETRQRHEFVAKIKEQGYQQAVEEVAYTWFNRFIALRFMEVNDYLPTHIRVFSDANGEFKPEILKEALHIELEGLDKVKVSELLNASKTEELYRYLLLTQCNALHAILPEMFEKMGNYTEMLLPNNILKPDGVLGRLVTDIPEEDWRDAVQIIGWMYQYYNTEPKQAVFDGLKKNIKITKEKIPAATQLFTPDWIVRYMVENSLGRLWLESHPNDKLKANWKYYIEEAEQTPEVAEKLRALREQSPVKSPEDIKLIDPCMGSGHILVYAFDVLMQIYESEGYNARDAAKLILEKNLYGLDIDRRACQLAYFSLMMKARQYHRRIFTENVRPQVYHPAGWSDGEEYGSLIKVDAIPPKPEQPLGQLTVFDDYERNLRVWNFKRLLAQKYDVVVTNPPYMGSKGQSAKISEFLKDNYPDTKSDTFSAFIERCEQMTKSTGYIGMFTPYVWMFIQSYEKLRNWIYSTKDIVNLIQFEYSAFEEATVPVCTFILRNGKIGATGEYLRLVDYRGGMEVQHVKTLEAIANPYCGYRYTATTENFKKLPGCPVAYWVSEKAIIPFENGVFIKNVAEPKAGLATGDNEVFQRYWHEVSLRNIGFGCEDVSQTIDDNHKWYPCHSGGEFRKWYTNNEMVVNWENNGLALRNLRNPKGKLAARPQNTQYYFKEGLTWNKLSSSRFAVKHKATGAIFDDTSRSAFPNGKEELFYIIGYLCSVVAFDYLKALYAVK